LSKKQIPKIILKIVYLLLASGKLDVEKNFCLSFTPMEEEFRMPKQKQDEVNTLLTNMKGSAVRAKGPRVDQHTSGPASKPDSLQRYIDLAPYKEHQAWPGRGYLLVGNSYNTEGKVKVKTKSTKRSGSIALLLEQGKDNRHTVGVEVALCHAGFVESLSRFEFDWLRREPPSSLIGQAYDEQGKLLPQSFAVWRVDVVQTKVGPKPKQLVGAK
jgi:hypothetical protein